jgi:threonine aldolase
LKNAQQCAKEQGLKIHLDGARMANAAVALGVDLKAIGECFDTVSLCLSKGLGAPIGSLLFGSKPFIDEARRWRKVTGGGMRQVGMLAAAGKMALTVGFERMHLDHENASYLAAQLEGVPGVSVREGWTQTNMVWLEFDDVCGEALAAEAQAANVLVSAYGRSCRVVTHHDVDKADVDRLVVLLKTFFEKQS